MSRPYKTPVIDALAAIDAYQRVNGYAPTYRELAPLLSLASISNVAYRIRSLALLGLVTFEEGKPRTMRLTDTGYDALQDGACSK